MKAVTTSLAVTRRSLRTLARCNNSPSIASVSEAEGSRRGFTAPALARISHSAKTASTTATRAALIPRVPVIALASGFGRDRLELGRDDLRSRHQIVHAAHLCHVERKLHRRRYIGRAHVTAGLELE